MDHFSSKTQWDNLKTCRHLFGAAACHDGETTLIVCISDKRRTQEASLFPFLSGGSMTRRKNQTFSALEKC
jgi:hypothetical protein